MISFIIPTIRPDNLPSLFDAIFKATSIEHEILHEEDFDRIGAPEMVKKLVDRAKFDWIVFLGDDTLPEEGSVDFAYDYAIKNDLWLVGLNDGHGEKSTHWIANRKLLDHLENREFFYTGYIHNFCDDELRVRAERLGRYGWCKDARIRHHHPAFDRSVSNETYEVQTDPSNWKHDIELFTKRNCRISVSMIVRNEEAMLSRCLESVRDADEIIVCDTGSTDNTVSIAREFTKNVFCDYSWNDDFSEARNYALSKCTGDWVLSIDADEVLEEGGIERVRELVLTCKHAVGIKMICSTTSYHVPRLFRNMPSIYWKGRIHETIGLLDYDRSSVVITYGSSPAHLLDPMRNVRILERDHFENPDDTRTMYYLGREYAYYKDWEKAEEMLEKYVSVSSWLPEKADAHFMLALCYWYDGKGNGERTRENCLKAININANFRAPILLMATASFENNAAQWRRMAETADNSGTLFARDRSDII